MQEYFFKNKNAKCIIIDTDEGGNCIKMDVSFFAYCYLKSIDTLSKKDATELLEILEFEANFDSQKEKLVNFIVKKSGSCTILYSGC